MAAAKDTTPKSTSGKGRPGYYDVDDDGNLVWHKATKAPVEPKSDTPAD